MLSGIGPKDHLTDMGIKTIQDLKVGYNLQDHVGLGGFTFLINQPISLVQVGENGKWAEGGFHLYLFSPLKAC